MLPTHAMPTPAPTPCPHLLLSALICNVSPSGLYTNTWSDLVTLSFFSPHKLAPTCLLILKCLLVRLSHQHLPCACSPSLASPHPAHTVPYLCPHLQRLFLRLVHQHRHASHQVSNQNEVAPAHNTRQIDALKGGNSVLAQLQPRSRKADLALAG